MASAITVRAPARTAVGSRRSGSRRDIQSMSAAYPAASQDASGAGSSGTAGARPTRVNWQAWAADLTAAAESTREPYVNAPDPGNGVEGKQAGTLWAAGHRHRADRH